MTSRAHQFVEKVLTSVNDALEAGDVSQLEATLEGLAGGFASPGTSDVVCKLNDEQRMVWGWALISTEHGEPHYDTQGDYVPVNELRAAVHDFAKRRTGKMMHKGGLRHEVVESLVLDADLQKALGIDLQREGWVVGVKIHDDEMWAEAKSGRLTGFSIGGKGERHAVQKGRAAPPDGVVLFADVT